MEQFDMDLQNEKNPDFFPIDPSLPPIQVVFERNYNLCHIMVTIFYQKWLIITNTIIMRIWWLTAFEMAILPF